MDAGDGNPVATANRELAEETDYTSGSGRLQASLSPIRGTTHTNRRHVILAQYAQRTQEPLLEPDESTIVVRMPVDEAIQIALRGGMVHAQ
ncbi:NUDIX domain-containing protein, partial [Microvirga aerophila]